MAILLTVAAKPGKQEMTTIITIRKKSAGKDGLRFTPGAAVPVFLLMIVLLVSLAAGFMAADGPVGWPEQSGTNILANSHLLVDASHASQGYFMAAVSETTDKRMKLRVARGETTFTYDLNGAQEYEVFPLQLGSGTYEISLYKNISGKKYAQEGSVVLDITLDREDGAFLYPNQYIDYGEASPLVAKAQELCGGSDDRQAFEQITAFMKSDFVYDFVRAITVSPGELPDAEGCFEKRMGICQDLSAVMVAMLRSRGIPARMMIGYADKEYHAWTETMIGGETLFFDPTAALNAIAAPKEYTVERYY